MPTVNNILESSTESPSPSLDIGDIYYVLFRHKWKILFFALAGVVAAALLYQFTVPVYYSEAKLLVRYVMEVKSAEVARSDQQIQSASSGGDSIINSEIEILSSFDLCLQVAAAVGPEKIMVGSERVLGPGGGGSNFNAQAAQVIMKGLSVEQVRRGNVIKIRFAHSNPEVVQPVVQQLIKAYLDRHVEIHRPMVDGDDALAKQADLLRSRLIRTEEELQKLKNKANVISVEDSKKAYTEQLSRIQQDIFNTEAEIAEQKAAAAEAGIRAPVTNQSLAAEPGVSQEKLNEYRATLVRFETLRNREFDLLSVQRYTTNNPLVKAVRQQLTEIEEQKTKQEQETPQLANYSIPTATTSGPVPGFPEAPNRVKRLEARLTILKSQFETVRTNVASLDALETDISQLQLRKELETKNYRYLAGGVEQARFDEALGSRKLSNINVIQVESPPSRSSTQRFKLVSMALVGGLALGIGLAFLIELFLDRTLKRPIEVEARLHLPLFFTFPRVALGGPKPGRPLIGGANGASAPSTESVTIVPAPFEGAMRPLMEDLRDRTLQHFEGNHKKPKLVGVTGCTVGVGVSTIAAGLAAALSEAAEGSVLLVDMNLGHGVAHPFFNGKSSCGIVDAIGGETRQSGFVSENLYLAKAARGKDLETRSLPKRISEIMPKLKASDFDYIIFDLPPITRAGSTLRLAGMMDLSLLIVEAEKDEQGVLTTASALLAESKANVSVVMNKVRSYVPAWLHREL